MARLLLALLMFFSLTLTFGCALNSAKSPTTAPTTTATPSDSLSDDQGKIREESFLATPQTTVMPESLTSQEKPILAGLQVVPFAYNQHLLSEEARNIITANAVILKKAGKVKFQLAGHCDERGSDQYNIALGERRAKAVRAYLLELGIDTGRMETVSYGEEQPLDAGHDENAWMNNRRVEFVLLP